MRLRFCLISSCFLALLFPFARGTLFCLGVGIKAKQLGLSLKRLRRLRPDTFTLTAAVVFLAASVLLVSAAVPLDTQTATAGTLFLLSLSDEAEARETEGIYFAAAFFLVGMAFLLAVFLTARLSDGLSASFCTLVVLAAWEQKNSLSAVFLDFFTH